MTAVLGVEIGRPDKPLFGPPDPVTKLELADYAAAVAPAMLPLVRDRPLNLERFPDGIDGRRLFTQNAPAHFPTGLVERVTVRAARGRTVTHAVATAPEALVYLAGQAAITVHAWPSRRDRLDRPDRLGATLRELAG